MKIWIVIVESDNHDHLMEVYKHKPTDEELEKLILLCWGGEETWPSYYYEDDKPPFIKNVYGTGFYMEGVGSAEITEIETDELE